MLAVILYKYPNGTIHLGKNGGIIMSNSSENKITLSAADENAIMARDDVYLLNKGAALYSKGDYKSGAEYYRLAAAMGNDQAIANLGYVYLYGRGIEPNLSVAMAYFKIAAKRNNADGAYKLGDIHSSDKWCVKDTELSVYYYRLAASLIIDGECDQDEVIYSEKLKSYPSLCFAMGREMSVQGNMATNLGVSYQFLKLAEVGYELELAAGHGFYEGCLAGVKELLSDPQYDVVREEYDGILDFGSGDGDNFGVTSDCDGKIMPS